MANESMPCCIYCGVEGDVILTTTETPFEVSGEYRINSITYTIEGNSIDDRAIIINMSYTNLSSETNYFASPCFELFCDHSQQLEQSYDNSSVGPYETVICKYRLYQNWCYEYRIGNTCNTYRIKLIVKY